MWASILSALGTNLFNGLSARRANKLNQKNYEEVRRYNTPVAQMGRFRAAGLNPNLIYSQQNTAEQRPEWRSPTYDLSSLSNIPSELSQYQNIRESKARVDNLVKQNKLLDEQITSQIISNNFAEKLNTKNIEYIDKQIEQINKAIENIDFEQDFKNRELNNNSIQALWNFAFQYASIGLQRDQFKLEQDKFNEFKRQFNLTHKGSAFFDEFIKELAKIHGSTGSDAVKILAKTLAHIFLNGFGT